MTGFHLRRKCRLNSLLVAVFFSGMSAQVTVGDDRVDFNRDIRPIFSNTCYKCHGPDEKQRQAGLRLDDKDVALGELDSGERAIVPGNVSASVLYQKISSADADERMPPVDSGKTLKPEQIALIKKWIEQGAPWRGHWSFIKPERPMPPAVKHEEMVRNPIDRFILARAEQEGLTPSTEADKLKLIRRVTFDLTGLPPTLDEIDAFVADKSPQAYENLVDRLLKSTRYGEHMTRYWLDAARYGDTHGLHLDNRRSLWPYRDWVIRAFNNNMPFDQFTIEQLAGDLLPNPTLEQRVATGFNRCNVTTSEGGSIAEEYLVRYAVDRVETTSTVFMGLTAGCAVCHDHKFDPISQRDFYGMYAYFFSLTEKAMDGNALLPPPIVRVATAEQVERKKQLQQQLAEFQKTIKAELAKVKYVEPKSEEKPQPTERQEYVWIDDDLPSGAKAQGNSPWKFVTKPNPVLSGEKSSTRTAGGLSQHFFTDAKPGLRIGDGDILFAYVYLDPKNPPKEVMLQFNDGNWEHRAIWGENLIDWGKANTPSRLPMGKLPETGKWVRLEVEVAKVGLKPGAVLNGWAFTQFDGTVYWDKAGIVTITPQGGAQFDSLLAWEQVQRTTKNSLPKPVQDAIKLQPDRRSAEQQQQVVAYFVEHAWSQTRQTFDPLHKQVASVNKQLADLEKAIPGTLVMQDMPERRQAHVLIRGQYDKPGDKVDPGVPASLPPLPKDAPPNRLALAKWLVDPSHPLTSRVRVNRFWQHLFGTGIVKTSEDFGSQGEWPSHPKLLDWLAIEFIESGWDVKHMMKLMVVSHTYRQSSHVTPEHLKKDLANRLLARGPRFRLDAEVIRDNALAVSGLLVEKVGGPSVKPYQPDGLWFAVGYSGSNTVRFTQDHGNDLYRRSMYIFWKRTAPPPTMQIFDAPSREYCVMRRERTNTPGGALVLMNDIQFVEAARRLAQRMMTEPEMKPADRITFAFRLATARPPESDELDVLLKMYEKTLAKFKGNTDAATKLVSVGESPRDEKLDISELAAWTMVASAILNLDETITKG